RRRRRPHLRLHRGWPNLRYRQRSRRLLQLPHPRGAPRHARPRFLLAPPSLLSCQHPPHQGSRPLVQIQFHAKNERQKILRNPRLPPTNQTPPRTLHTLAKHVAQALLPVFLGSRLFALPPCHLFLCGELFPFPSRVPANLFARCRTLVVFK